LASARFFADQYVWEGRLSDGRQCQGITRRGEQCKRRAKAGSDFCGLHDGTGATPGAPVGNANARKHGFYGRLYTAGELEDLATAAVAGDLSDEIALLRVRIRRAAEEGVDLDIIIRALGRLTQMLKAQHVLSGDALDEFSQAMQEVVASVTEELGLSLG
jgi:hypothetical protein